MDGENNRVKAISICMLTYNHEKYITNAIESVLKQKINFEMELIIGEDSSLDKTRSICLKYESLYPSLIKVVEDIGYNIGAHKNFIRTFSACKGKYIALLEGDDYWTDPFKLQKQVDFFERNEDYVLCSHGYKIVDINNNIISNPSNELEDQYPCGLDITISVFFENWITKTLTTVFRRSAVDFKFEDYSFLSDTILFFHVLLKGKGYWMNINAGAYRIHETNNWNNLTDKKKIDTSYKTFKELYNHHPGNKPLKAALIKTNYLILEILSQQDRRTKFRGYEMLFYTFQLIINEPNKKDFLTFIKKFFISPLLLKSKIKIRCLIDKKYKEKYYDNV